MVKVHRERIVKSPETGYISPRGGTLGDVARELEAVRKLLLQPKIPLKGVKVGEEREKAVGKLVDAIAAVEKLAKKAKMETEERKPDMSKARYYQLLGYLIQVLDGVLKNIGLDELGRQLEKVEDQIREMESAPVHGPSVHR